MKGVIKIPVFDTECVKCKNIIEQVCVHNENFDECPLCGGKCKKIVSRTPPIFQLVYDPKKDSCDWSGNKTRYYDDYNRMKSEGKDVRIPELDGEKR